jgi:hypothetical protein
MSSVAVFFIRARIGEARNRKNMAHAAQKKRIG